MIFKFTSQKSTSLVIQITSSYLPLSISSRCMWTAAISMRKHLHLSPTAVRIIMIIVNFIFMKMTITVCKAPLYIYSHSLFLLLSLYIWHAYNSEWDLLIGIFAFLLNLSKPPSSHSHIHNVSSLLTSFSFISFLTCFKVRDLFFWFDDIFLKFYNNNSFKEYYLKFWYSNNFFNYHKFHTRLSFLIIIDWRSCDIKNFQKEF